ncbi:MAG: molybdenum cofactor biosynthesis protein MoaE [Acidobacteriota bacterium]
MEIKVLFFGGCREAAANNEITLTLPSGASVAVAFEELKGRYPELAHFGARLLFAVNEAYAKPEYQLTQGDTLAVFPPVSGGATPTDICELTHNEIDSRQLALRVLQPIDGAIVTFDGVTRNHNRNRTVRYLEYEAYEAMAIKVMHQIVVEVRERWSVDSIAIVHRLGRVDIGQTSVAIVVTSAHRKPAFEACHFLIDRLKQIVPIWKREYYQDGAVWVDPELMQ